MLSTLRCWWFLIGDLGCLERREIDALRIVRCVGVLLASSFLRCLAPSLDYLAFCCVASRTNRPPSVSQSYKTKLSRREQCKSRRKRSTFSAMHHMHLCRKGRKSRSATFFQIHSKHILCRTAIVLKPETVGISTTAADDDGGASRL